MALNNLGLGLSFIGRDRATPVIRKVNRAFDGLLKHVTATSRGVSQQLRSFHMLEARMTGIARGSRHMADAMRRSVGDVNGLVRGLDRASRSAGMVGTRISRGGTRGIGGQRAAVGTRRRARGARRRGGDIGADDLLRGAGIGLVAASGALPFKIAGFAGEFEQNLKRVQNISGATTEGLGLLREAALEAGLRTQFSPDEAVRGLEALAAAGFGLNEQIDMLNPSLDLAAGGMIDIDKATSLAATTIKGFQLASKDADDVADKLLKTTNLFKIQADQLEPALAKASRGALVAEQNFTEMLVAVGLAKNIFPDAGAAGNSISRALQGLAKNAKYVKDTFGVAVTDEFGKFRNALDIFNDIDKASRNIPDAAERANALNKALGGTFGLAGFTAVMASVREEAGKKGETELQAFQRLRDAIDEAGRKDLAKSFAANVLDTFQGQKVILQGAAQTLAVVIGEPFARVLKPVVTAVAQAISSLARFIAKLPDGIKNAMATVFSLGFAFIGLVSAILAAKVAFALISIAFGALIKVIVVTVSSLAVVIALVAGFAYAVKRNIGGLGDTFSRVYEAVSMFYRGVSQLFRQGGFSGAVREELNRVGNSGIKRFAINVYAIGFRVVRFFKGIGAGFVEALEAAAPAFARLREGLVALGEAFGLVARSGAEAAGGIPSEKFFATGARVGGLMARVLSTIADVIGVMARLWSGIVGGVTATFAKFGGVFTGLKDNIVEFIGVMGGGLGGIADGFGTVGDEAQSFGRLLGTVIGSGMVILTKLASVAVNVATWIVRAFRVVGFVVGPIVRLVIAVVTAAIETLDVMIGKLQDVVGFVSSIPGTVKGFAGEVAGDVVNFFSGDDEGSGPSAAIAAAGQAMQPPDGEREESGRSLDLAGMAAAAARAAVADVVRAMENRPVVLEADGVQIGRLADKGRRKDAALGFRAMPLEP